MEHWSVVLLLSTLLMAVVVGLALVLRPKADGKREKGELSRGGDGGIDFSLGRPTDSLSGIPGGDSGGGGGTGGSGGADGGGSSL